MLIFGRPCHPSPGDCPLAGFSPQKIIEADWWNHRALEINLEAKHNAELTAFRARVTELESLIEALKDPNVAWINMLRGHIGVPAHLKVAEERYRRDEEIN